MTASLNTKPARRMPRFLALAAPLIAGGVMLIIVGLLLLSGLWTQFVYWLRDFAISDTTLPI